RLFQETPTEMRQVGCRSDCARNQCQSDIWLQIKPHMIGYAITRAKSRHGLQMVQGLGQGFRAKQDPSNSDDKHDIDMAAFTAEALECRTETYPFNNEEEAMVQSPDN